jgi:phospholipid/cholesterol/gamma-HCH transport system ATP-binding protein
VPEKKTRTAASREAFVVRTGRRALALVAGVQRLAAFLGEALIAFGRLLTGRARFPVREFLVVVQDCGAAALPIVALVAGLVGLILAFMGAIQLRQFGAQVFVADLVAIGMVRDMGPIMVGIIMAGRTGAAFAAQLGTMTVNEEIDAFRTMGISPMEYLVLPRMLALILMMPLLSLYGDVLGILGGMLVGVGPLDIGARQYFDHTIHALTLKSIASGLFKGAVYGVIVACAGCMQGMACVRGRESDHLHHRLLRADHDRLRRRGNLVLSAPATSPAPAQISVRTLTMAYGSFVVQHDLDFDIRRGEVFVIMGDSGCGKSTLLRHMIGLLAPAKGDVLFSGESLWRAEPEQREQMMRRFGVLYQSGALWSSMTLAENVALPLQQYTNLSPHEVAELAQLKLALVGLAGFGEFYPSEISGGMCKRAGLARAMALDPEVLFFDEPSAGLDPLSSRRLDDLILELRDSLGSTFVVVTHELASIFTIADRAVFLDAEARTQVALGDPKQLREASSSEKVRTFLKRGEP